MRIRWKTIARVVKTHAKSGEVVVASVHGLPQLLRSGMTVAIVPPQLKSNRYLTVADVDDSGGSALLVSFDGISSINDAQELVGRHILAKVDDLPQNIDLLDRESLVGRRVFDAAGNCLGMVLEVMAGPTQDVYVLSGDAGEVLVPVIPEFVVSVDAESIVLDLPDGILSSQDA